MPESVTDRPTKAHETVFLLTKEPRYFYDADAIWEPHHPDGRRVDVKTVGTGSHANHQNVNGKPRWPDNGGRNKRSVWEIATQPYPMAHFATFPQALVEPCVLAGTSERGCCPVCGAPWEREVELVQASEGFRNSASYWQTEPERRKRVEPHRTPGMVPGRTIGWRPSCSCRMPSVEGSHPGFTGQVPCTVLDPFLGSGTTALVARRLGRRCVGIELSPEYAALAARRTQQLSVFA